MVSQKAPSLLGCALVGAALCERFDPDDGSFLRERRMAELTIHLLKSLERIR
jgi:hypothetical protein